MSDSFEQRLKELRKERNMTQQQLADALQTSKGTVSIWERGGRKPEFGTLEQLCDLFYVSLGYLLGEDVDRTRTDPTNEELGRWALEEEQEDTAHLFLTYLQLSDRMQRVVTAAIREAYKQDRHDGTLKKPDKKHDIGVAEEMKYILNERLDE